MLEPGETTSWNLIHAAAQAGDPGREEFARKYAARLRTWFTQRWHASPLREEIEDAVQEVFLDCFRPQGALTRVEPSRGSGFRGFLYGVARNVALRHEQARARIQARETSDSILEQAPARPARGSMIMDRAWALDVVRMAHRRMADRLRERPEVRDLRLRILELRFEDQRPIREIAAALDLDAERVQKEYARARQDFHRALIEEIRARRPDEVFDAEAECVRLLSLLAQP